MSPNLVLIGVEWGWCFASSLAVLLSLWAIPRARRVHGDTLKDATAMERSGQINGRLSFARQQLREGIYLLRAHWKCLAHQSIFLAVGVYALWEENEPIPVGTPLLEYVGVPVFLLVAQYIILWLQVDLVRVTFEQEAWRTESLQDRSRLEGIARDTNTRVREIQQRGLSDRPAEETDREEGREHRGGA